MKKICLILAIMLVLLTGCDIGLNQFRANYEGTTTAQVTQIIKELNQYKGFLNLSDTTNYQIKGGVAVQTQTTTIALVQDITIKFKSNEVYGQNTWADKSLNQGQVYTYKPNDPNYGLDVDIFLNGYLSDCIRLTPQNADEVFYCPKEIKRIYSDMWDNFLNLPMDYVKLGFHNDNWYFHIKVNEQTATYLLPSINGNTASGAGDIYIVLNCYTGELMGLYAKYWVENYVDGEIIPNSAITKLQVDFRISQI